MARQVMMRKLRTGHWASTGQGNGSVQDDASGTDDENDDAGTGTNLSQEDQIKALKHEARRRRLEAKEAKRERDELKQQMADNGQSHSGPDPSDVILTLVESGMSKDRIRAAMKLVDWSEVTDVDDAIEELREEHPFLFESAQKPQELPAQGSKGNRDKNKGGPANRQDLMNKYPALRR